MPQLSFIHLAAGLTRSARRSRSANSCSASSASSALKEVWDWRVAAKSLLPRTNGSFGGSRGYPMAAGSLSPGERRRLALESGTRSGSASVPDGVIRRCITRGGANSEIQPSYTEIRVGDFHADSGRNRSFTKCYLMTMPRAPTSSHEVSDWLTAIVRNRVYCSIRVPTAHRIVWIE